MSATVLSSISLRSAHASCPRSLMSPNFFDPTCGGVGRAAGGGCWRCGRSSRSTGRARRRPSWRTAVRLVRTRALSPSISERPSGCGVYPRPSGLILYPYFSSCRSLRMYSGIKLIVYDSVVTLNSGASGHGWLVSAAPPVLCRCFEDDHLLAVLGEVGSRRRDRCGLPRSRPRRTAARHLFAPDSRVTTGDTDTD